MTQSLITIDKFSPEATQLRQVFDERFSDPRQARGDRFVWDWWHVPGQYTALRTPAYHYFPKKIYDIFHQQLVWWGRRNLGCHDVSPTWLSCYIDNCEQEVHGDVPHGPWAFVFSLTNWKNRTFRGGETLLLREEILNYWGQADFNRGLEHGDVFQEVQPLFNRLTVFDPRIPHGVRRVQNTTDPREGRLVIHGWFVKPRPFIEGPLTEKELKVSIEGLSKKLETEIVAGNISVHGTLSLRLQINKWGEVEAMKFLTDSLRSRSLDPQESLRIRKLVKNYFQKEAVFRKRSQGSLVTLPLMFD